MDEEKEEVKVDKPVDTGEGVQSETISELDRADQIAERQARENDRREKLLEREEALEARRAVGGTTEAGGVEEKPVKTKEEAAKDYIEKNFANLK